MDVLERLYEINNFNVHTKRKQRIEQLQKKAQIAKKNRGDLIEKMKLRKSLLVSAPEEKVIHIDTEETEEETKVDTPSTTYSSKETSDAFDDLFNN